MIFLAILSVAIWGFDRFYYVPQKKKIMELKAEIAAVDSRLAQGLALRQGIATVEKEIARLEKELQSYQERLPRGEEIRAFLKQLAKDSDQLPMKIISLAPHEEGPSPESEKKEKPAQYKRVTVRMTLQTTYSALEKFLRNVEHLPFLISVDHLKIERKEEIYPYLQITLEMKVQVLEK